MLELLHIENIAVIEEADIQFRPGFNALTGETGAGKSIAFPLTRTGTCCSSGKSPATARTPAGPMDGPSPWPSSGRLAGSS